MVRPEYDIVTVQLSAVPWKHMLSKNQSLQVLAFTTHEETCTHFKPAHMEDLRQDKRVQFNYD